MSDYTKNLVTESLVASAVKSAMVELSPANVTNRAKIEPLVLAKLNDSLAGKYGADTVYVCKITIGDMDFEAALYWSPCQDHEAKNIVNHGSLGHGIDFAASGRA